jgi:hypothetical protein
MLITVIHCRQSFLTMQHFTLYLNSIKSTVARDGFDHFIQPRMTGKDFKSFYIHQKFGKISFILIQENAEDICLRGRKKNILGCVFLCSRYNISYSLVNYGLSEVISSWRTLLLCAR